jgi:hypothetical protein
MKDRTTKIGQAGNGLAFFVSGGSGCLILLWRQPSAAHDAVAASRKRSLDVATFSPQPPARITVNQALGTIADKAPDPIRESAGS